jgi:lipid II:glycine glycyltransferase (peptidoglycan interpeptide bridge formation enzyme)
VRTTRLNRSSIGAAYALIEANRLALGVTPSVSLIQMMKMVDEMPDVYQSFGTYFGSELVAAAITVMITDKIRYVYMWADDARYRLSSPVVALCDGIIKYSIDMGNLILDLGTASEFGKVNDGLSRFKTNLGAISTNKITYLISTF